MASDFATNPALVQDRFDPTNWDLAGTSRTNQSNTDRNAITQPSFDPRSSGSLDAGPADAEALSLSRTASVLLAQGGDQNPSPLRPDAWYYGIGTGSVASRFFAGSVSLVTPDGNPFNATSLYVYKDAPFLPTQVGGIGIYNFKTGTTDVGFAKWWSFEAAGLPVVGFIAGRGSIPKNFTGTVSASLGALISVNQVAARALGAAALAAANPAAAAGTGGTSAGAAGGLLTASLIAEASSKVANLNIGVSYTVKLKYEGGKIEGIYYKDKKIVDLKKFFADILATSRRYKPDVGLNYGNEGLAGLHSVTQLIYGTSPWDLARSAGDKDTFAAPVILAQTWSRVLKEHGTKHLALLPPDVRSIVMLGPRNNAEAARAVNAILERSTSQEAWSISSKLANPYGIDLNVPAVRFQNGARYPLPSDEAPFVKSVFAGDYRHESDLRR